MSLNINLAIVKVLILAQTYGLVLGITCPEATKLLPCKCYPLSGQIRCEDITTGFDETMLEKIGQALSGQFPFLYIHKTSITKIKAGTFKTAKFEKIFITNNDALETIDIGAFVESAVTDVLEIRQNKALKENGLFDIAKKLGTTLTTIGFDENNFLTLDNLSTDPAQLKFDIASFPQLESLNLQNQLNQATNNLVLKSNFISNLPFLRQLSLDKIGIKTIQDDAIVLESTSPKNSPKHISIFLNDNKLTGEQLTISKIKLPKAADVTIGLVLENNKDLTVNAANVALWKAIADKGGNVYINGISMATCTCAIVKPLTDASVWTKIHITPEPDCGTTKLSQCKNTP